MKKILRFLRNLFLGDAAKKVLNGAYLEDWLIVENRGYIKRLMVDDLVRLNERFELVNAAPYPATHKVIELYCYEDSMYEVYMVAENVDTKQKITVKI